MLKGGGCENVGAQYSLPAELKEIGQKAGRDIEGVEAGRRLTAHGRIGRRREERVLYNPAYELEA